jgi:hypothetical protein
MIKGSLVLAMAFFVSVAWPQDRPKRYPWQHGDTNCTEWMTFCWYGAESVSNPEVIAYGSRWVSQDKDEKPIEWVTQVRCVQDLHVCILARNQKIGDRSQINTDLYRVKEWSDFQIRAIGESDFPRGKECEMDSLVLNRAEASVMMLSVPGPGATTEGCMASVKPKTVLYKLSLG